ncbi:MAG: lipoate--protein ligase [Bacteroidota bacterium]|nr:lipoate--protein ligase [Bacteroidota bacterium]
MLYIRRTSTDPYFNIAAEEYVLKEFKENCFMLWQNDPSIIVGKHQNTLAEINYAYVKEKGIPVVRRISGGGTVFHDPGNLNFTFIQNGTDENLVNFKKYTEPILEVLRSMGIDARFEGHNNLTIRGKKFSGNAEHVYKNRTLHHGTLLFSSTLPELTRALKIEAGKFQDKAVKSVPQAVTNLQDHLEEKLSIEEFKNRIRDYLLGLYPGAKHYAFSKQDISKINELVNNKYSTWEWNFGYSPKYSLKKSVETAKGRIDFVMDIKNGLIQKLKIGGDLPVTPEITVFEQSMTGAPHEEKELANKLKTLNINEIFQDVGMGELLKGFF